MSLDCVEHRVQFASQIALAHILLAAGTNEKFHELCHAQLAVTCMSHVTHASEPRHTRPRRARSGKRISASYRKRAHPSHHTLTSYLLHIPSSCHYYSHTHSPMHPPMHSHNTFYIFYKPIVNTHPPTHPPTNFTNSTYSTNLSSLWSLAPTDSPSHKLHTTHYAHSTNLSSSLSHAPTNPPSHKLRTRQPTHSTNLSSSKPHALTDSPSHKLHATHSTHSTNLLSSMSHAPKQTTRPQT